MVTNPLGLASSEEIVFVFRLFYFPSFPGDSTEARSALSITMDPNLGPDVVSTEAPCALLLVACQIYANMVSQYQI